MAWTKLQLYNGALRLCGERKVTLTEDREPRRLLDDVWDEDVVKTCLEQGQWQFAKRSVEIESSANVSPPFGYSYAFEFPSDYVRTILLASDEYFENTLKYAQEGNYLFGDIDPVYLAYVSDDVAYGRDMSLWPQSFGKFVQAEMAYEIGPRLTGVKVDMEKMERVRNKRLLDAQNKDGVNRPVRFPPRGSWVNARHGRYTRYADRRR